MHLLRWLTNRKTPLTPAQNPHTLRYPDYGPEPALATKPDAVRKKVLMITHNPILKTQGGRAVKEYFGWNDPDQLADAYVEDVRWASYGYANYEIVERLVVNGYPIKRDGFRYDEASYLAAWRKRQFHEPDGVDYLALVREFDLVGRINSGQCDEIWLFGHPYGGYYESIMGGPDAFWCNAPPLAGTEHAQRRFVIMGFNFERGVGEMLEDLGHRAESMMFKVYDGVDGPANLWERFIRYDKTHPQQAEVGNVHFAPNSTKDYEWGNATPVLSRHHTWYNYPHLDGRPQTVTCADWGDGDIRLHHLWWFRHIPHLRGAANGVSHNWWDYIIDPNQVVVG